MSDLTGFLLARIAEDEGAAQAAGDYPLWPLGAARLLAECDAKRRIMVWHSQYDTTGCGDGGPHGREDQCPTFQALALPYAGHPDYDEAWRP